MTLLLKKWVKKDLVKLGIDIYHGLSHEIPFGIQNTSVKSVVTMHDLIFERNPEQYNPIDVKIYRKKFKYACVNANHIIAISHQTKNDLIVITGDIMDNGYAVSGNAIEMAKYLYINLSNFCPIISILGNHDIKTNIDTLEYTTI